MEITARELAKRLGLNEANVKLKLCNFQVQEFITCTKKKLPTSIKITEKSLYALEKLLYPELHVKNRAEKIKKFHKFVEDYRNGIDKDKKVFNCF